MSGKTGEPPYYAVGQGREPGIYRDWTECKDQVHGHSGNDYKKFSNEKDAQDHLDLGRSANEYNEEDKYYVVKKGFEPGTYDSWHEARKQVDYYPGNEHRSFPKDQGEEAQKYAGTGSGGEVSGDSGCAENGKDSASNASEEPQDCAKPQNDGSRGGSREDVGLGGDGSDGVLPGGEEHDGLDEANSDEAKGGHDGDGVCDEDVANHDDGGGPMEIVGRDDDQGAEYDDGGNNTEEVGLGGGGDGNDGAPPGAEEHDELDESNCDEVKGGYDGDGTGDEDVADYDDYGPSSIGGCDDDQAVECDSRGGSTEEIGADGGGNGSVLPGAEEHDGLDEANSDEAKGGYDGDGVCDGNVADYDNGGQDATDGCHVDQGAECDDGGQGEVGGDGVRDVDDASYNDGGQDAIDTCDGDQGAECDDGCVDEGGYDDGCADEGGYDDACDGGVDAGCADDYDA